MIRNYKRYIIGLFMLVLLVSFTGNLTYGRIIQNESQSAFEDDPPAEGGASVSGVMSTAQTLESYIIKSAGYFLKAHSQALTMMNTFEMSDLEGVNIAALKSQANDVIDTLNAARDTYDKLLTKAKSSRYNQKVIDKLTNFNYNGFKYEKSLNSSIFNDVKYFLSKCDVIGGYAETLSRVNMILADLNAIKNMLDGNTLPTNSAIWRLNQTFSETQLFGQYVAEVFYRISTGE